MQQGLRRRRKAKADRSNVTIEVFPQYDRIEGTAEHDNGNTVVLGYANGIGLTNSHIST